MSKTRKQNAKRIKQNSQASKDNRLLTYVKKIFTWQSIMGIIAILTFGFLIYDRYCKISEPERLKEKIYRNIGIIEKDFHPESISQLTDSMNDINLIKEFQRNALELCTMWKAIDSAKPYSDYVKLGKSGLKNVLEVEFSRQNKCNELIKKVITLTQSIYLYGEEHNIEEYTSLSYSRLSDIEELVTKKNDITSKHRQKCIEYLNKKDVKNGMKELDDLRKEPEYYMLDDALFEFIIEMNKMCEIVIHKEGMGNARKVSAPSVSVLSKPESSYLLYYGTEKV